VVIMGVVERLRMRERGAIMSHRASAARTTKAMELAPFPDGGTPAWEVAYLFPAQGTWTECDYFGLDHAIAGVQRFELSNGRREVVAMPTQSHELIVLFMLRVLEAFTMAHAPGMVFPAGIRVMVGRGKFRMPDICYMKAENAHRRHDRNWDG